MRDHEGTLRILGAAAGHDYMADVHDASSDTYACFEAHPLSDVFQGQGITTAIVDTGLLSTHPVIHAHLTDAVDFTGEGPEDEHGHGTVVALLYLVDMPQAPLVSVKVLRRHGESSPDDLVRAFHWLEKNERVSLVNVSAGVTRPKCRGHCDVCEGARAVVRAGKIVTVAAGNIPGITACPAKASDAVVTITAVDSSGRLASYASPATKRGYSESVPRVHYYWVDNQGNPVAPL